MGRTAIILMIITLISKVTGLIREQFFARFLGVGNNIDIYNTASTIPTILFSFIIAGVVAGYIPVYSKAEHEQGEERAKLFTSNLLNILLIITTLVIILIYFLAPLLVTLFAKGYTGDKRLLTIKFTRIMSLSLYASMISSVFIGYLRLKNRFVVAETAGIFMNILNIITLYISVYTNKFIILPIGYVITEYLKYFLFPHYIRKENYKHTFSLDIKDKYLRNMLKIAIPIFISIAAVDVSTIFDQSLASVILNDGGVSSMRLASLILTLVSGVIVVSITTAIYPKLSKYANENNMKKVKKILMNSNIYSFILIIPSMIGVIILSEPIIRILFNRGNFDEASTQRIAEILMFYMPTIIGQSINQIFTRGFYSLQNTKLPIYITLVQVISNILLNYVFSAYLGLNGLALATTVSSFIGGILSVYLFVKEYGSVNFRKFIKNSIKILIASGIMGILTYLSYHALESRNYILALFVSIIVSILSYAILIVLMRIPDVMRLINNSYHRYVIKTKPKNKNRIKK